MGLGPGSWHWLNATHRQGWTTERGYTDGKEKKRNETAGDCIRIHTYKNISHLKVRATLINSGTVDEKPLFAAKCPVV